MAHAPTFYKAPRYLFRKHNVISMIKNQKDIKTFADIGCGAGELACTLARKGYKGKGIDFSKNALEVANKIKSSYGVENGALTFVMGGIEKIDKKNTDVTICCEVLEHIEDDEQFLKELHAANPKYAIFSVPARQKWFDHFDERVGHYRRYEKDDLIKLLHKNGFSVIDFRSYGYPFINGTRLLRKAMARNVKEQTNIKKRTQESGINPIKLKGTLAKIDIEPLTKLLHQLTRPFNRFNLSEGYVVMCKRKDPIAD